MVRPEFDAHFINRIANSASVRPFIDYRDSTEPLDLSPAIGRPDLTGCLFLSNGVDAVGAFGLTDVGEWQGHILFADTCRGRRALDTGREMLRVMEDWGDKVWGAIPRGNRRARWFARQIGLHAIAIDHFDREGEVEIFVKGDGPPRARMLRTTEAVH